MYTTPLEQNNHTFSQLFLIFVINPYFDLDSRIRPDSILSMERNFYTLHLLLSCSSDPILTRIIFICQFTFLDSLWK